MLQTAANIVSSDIKPSISVEIADNLSSADMEALCDATRAVIEKSHGFGWQHPPAKHILERFWQGVLVVPERSLIVARIDDVICGAVQLVEPSKNNEIQAFSVNMVGCFVAPWAEEFSASKKLIEMVENLAVEKGYNVINTDVQETELKARELLIKLGYSCWGVHPNYANIEGRIVKGMFFTKTLYSDFALQTKESV